MATKKPPECVHRVQKPENEIIQPYLGIPPPIAPLELHQGAKDARGHKNREDNGHLVLRKVRSSTGLA